MFLGRGRKVFEFKDQFNDIYEKKKNIRPAILLSAKEVITPTFYPNDSENGTTISMREEMNQAEYEVLTEEESVLTPAATSSQLVGNVSKISNQTITPSSNLKRKRSVRTISSTYKKRNEILIEMKNDLKKYYDDKSKRDQEKLELEKQKQADRTKRTALLQEFVNMLKGSDL